MPYYETCFPATNSEPLLIKLQDAPYGWNVTTTFINSQNLSTFAVKYITHRPSGSVGLPLTSDSGVSCISGGVYESGPGETGLWVELTCRNDPPGVCPIQYYIVSHAHDAPPPAPSEPTEPPTEAPTSTDTPVAPVVSPSSSAASIAQSLVLFAMAAALFFNTQ
jgi:hypothetical protein